MSDWRDRLRPQIVLRAPDGTRFICSWQANDIEAGKRVAQFDYPLVDGTETQDLGAKGLTFPLTLSFEGDDHDTLALAFLRALSQRGNWTVSHPVYGGLSLQPISAKLSADPTASANVSKVESEWIEPAVTDLSLSAAELGAQVSSLAEELNSGSIEQVTATVDLTDPEAAAAAATAGTQGLSSLKASKLNALIQKSTDLQAAFADYYTRAQEAFTAVPMDLVEAAGQVQAISQLPALVSGDVATKIEAFGEFSGRLLAALVPAPDVNARNAAQVSELFLEAAISGAALSAATSAPETREQAVDAIRRLNALLSEVGAGLDAVQEARAGNTAAAQYFSNGRNFATLARLVGLAVALLLRQIFDLKVAKRFTLSRPRAPIEITISEYGELGPEDSYLDLFIASNHLRSDEVILLPAGREVVVYV